MMSDYGIQTLQLEEVGLTDVMMHIYADDDFGRLLMSVAIILCFDN